MEKESHSIATAGMQQTLPAKVAKIIGCMHKRGCSFETGWSHIFVKILGQFLCHLSMQDNLFCLAHGEVT